MSQFCGNCGAQSDGQKFCTRCGKSTTSASSSERDLDTGQIPVTKAPPAQTLDDGVSSTSGPEIRMPEKQKGGATKFFFGDTRRRTITLVSAASLAIVIIVVILLLTLGGGSPYQSQVAQDFSPIWRDNVKLTATVAALKPNGSTAALTSQLSQASQDVTAAKNQITGNPNGDPNSGVGAQALAALRIEASWLQNATLTLGNPASSASSQLSSLGTQASSDLHQVASTLSVTTPVVFPSSAPILAWVQAQQATAANKAADTAFSNSVANLLNQSTATYQMVNDFYNQLQNVANGGSTYFTLAQAEQQISQIVANRTSLVASASALAATTPEAQNVQQLLVAAFNASLKDDTDLDTCLNQANYGSYAVIFQSCLTNSQADSSAATTAKQAFLQAFNQLRATIGQPPMSPQF
jgi:hypothetical protein